MGAILLGFSGGLLGAFFIKINNFINIYRKKYLTKKYLKVIEALVLISVTATTMYFTVYFKYLSADHPSNDTDYCQINKDVQTR